MGSYAVVVLAKPLLMTGTFCTTRDTPTPAALFPGNWVWLRNGFRQRTLWFIPFFVTVAGYRGRILRCGTCLVDTQVILTYH